MATTPEKIVIPGAGDFYDYVEEQRKMAASQRTIVPAADRAAGDAIVTAMGADGRPVSDTQPVYVHNFANKGLEYKASEGIWRPVTPARIFGHMGKTNGFQALSNGGLPVQITMDAAQKLLGGVTFDNANDALVVPIAGEYRVKTKYYFSGSSGEQNTGGIYINGVNTNIQSHAAQAQQNKAGSADIYFHSDGTVTLAANDKVSMYQISGVSAWGSNGYNGAFLEVEYLGP